MKPKSFSSLLSVSPRFLASFIKFVLISKTSCSPTPPLPLDEKYSLSPNTYGVISSPLEFTFGPKLITLPNFLPFSEIETLKISNPPIDSNLSDAK